MKKLVKKFELKEKAILENVEKEGNRKNKEIEKLREELENANLKVKKNGILEEENQKLKTELNLKINQEKILSGKLNELEQNYLKFTDQKINKIKVVKKQNQGLSKLILKIDWESFDKEMTNFKNFIN